MRKTGGKLLNAHLERFAKDLRGHTASELRMMQRAARRTDQYCWWLAFRMKGPVMDLIGDELQWRASTNRSAAAKKRERRRKEGKADAR